MMTREFLFYAQPLGTHIYANAPGSVGVSPAAYAQPLIAVGSILYVRPPHIAQPT